MSQSTSNLRPAPKTHYFQYVDVTLSNGVHEFTYQTFLETASPKGLSDVDIEMFLTDKHDLHAGLGTDGLEDGFFWTKSDTAVGVFPKARGNDTHPRVVSSDEPDIAQLIRVAPELFEFDW